MKHLKNMWTALYLKIRREWWEEEEDREGEEDEGADI